MGDWERIFGCGVSAEDVIDSIERANRAEQRYESRKTFSYKQRFNTFQEASDWAKSNPGKSIMRASDGNGFVEK